MVNWEDEPLLEKARQTVNARQAEYPKQLEEAEALAKIWDVLYNIHLSRQPAAQSWDYTISPRLVALFMIALKLTREAHAHKEDNLVDIIGYAVFASEVEAGLGKPVEGMQ